MVRVDVFNGFFCGFDSCDSAAFSDFRGETSSPPPAGGRGGGDSRKINQKKKKKREKKSGGKNLPLEGTIF